MSGQDWEDLSDTEIAQRLEHRGYDPGTINQVLRYRYHHGELPSDAVRVLEK